MTRLLTAAALLLATASPWTAPSAAPNLVVNGGFDQQTAPAAPIQITTSNVIGWSTTGFNFAFSATNADNGGFLPSFLNQRLALWGPGNGAANGLGPSPDGGNYVGLDGAYDVAPLTQTLHGLTIGDTYAVSFYWAAAEQYLRDGSTTNQFAVSLGDETHKTKVASIPEHGFSGWMAQTFDYTATSGDEVLSFLANGTPSGAPPFALLDGISATDVTATPEPGAWALLATGLGILGVAQLRRRAR